MEEARRIDMEASKIELVEAFHELVVAGDLLRRKLWDGEGSDQCVLEALALLLSITQARLECCTKKYGLKVPHAEAFWPEDTGKWLDFKRDPGRSESTAARA